MVYAKAVVHYFAQAGSKFRQQVHIGRNQHILQLRVCLDEPQNGPDVAPFTTRARDNQNLSQCNLLQVFPAQQLVGRNAHPGAPANHCGQLLGGNSSARPLRPHHVRRNFLAGPNLQH
ncbi:MAG: hypothetical protein JW388_0319 [Nitrospira sp.]|nr:hypothetical protein [Nitrospira sp.]